MITFYWGVELADKFSGKYRPKSMDEEEAKLLELPKFTTKEECQKWCDCHRLYKGKIIVV